MSHHHHHTHGEACTCGHDHHEHEHHHHDEHCSCGHDHHEHKHHHHDEHCSCGHDHHEHEHHHEAPKQTVYPQKIFLLDGLGCANCAAKMEARINALEEVEYASITYATKQLRISASVNVLQLMPQINEIVHIMESIPPLFNRLSAVALPVSATYPYCNALRTSAKLAP